MSQEKYNKDKEVKLKSEGEITAIAVDDKNGNFVRVFSFGLHGEAFKELADGYANKIKGKTRKATDEEVKAEEVK